MDRAEQYKWSIIYTDHKNEYIHLDHLKKSNPNAQIILANVFHGITHKSYAWRNCDNLIRLWLKNNISLIQYEKIAILEWDVLITQPLPNIEINGLICKHKKIPSIHTNWTWFREIKSLDKYQKYAIGISPLGVMFMNKLCIETWLDHEFDELYSKDIFCELRLPTMLNSKNISVQEYNMPYVWYENLNMPIGVGIYHPIKNKYLSP